MENEKKTTGTAEENKKPLTDEQAANVSGGGIRIAQAGAMASVKLTNVEGTVTSAYSKIVADILEQSGDKNM